MIKFLLFLSLLLSSRGFADEQLNSKPIVKHITYSGFVPPTYPRFIEVILYEDGTLMQHKNFADGSVESVLLATYNPFVIGRIMNAASQLSRGKLVSSTPDAPICMDAPSVEASTINANGEFVLLFGWENCHDLVREDGIYFDYIEFIKSFSALSNLVQ
ncbi:hypothetical protein MEO40_06970 [Dolichospermum sp. ST_sed1]|nr:hypothetical protein [Dolichospermum sp. ST_sed1]